VRYFEGTPITSTSFSSILLAGLVYFNAIHDRLPLGKYVDPVFGLTFHPWVLVYVASGVAMVARRLRVPKPSFSHYRKTTWAFIVAAAKGKKN
jgi:hypothetical protein